MDIRAVHLPRPAGQGEYTAEQISMMTLGRRGSVCKTAGKKAHCWAWRAHQIRHRPLPAPLETPWTKTG